MHGDPPGHSSVSLCQVGAKCDDFDLYIDDKDEFTIGDIGPWVWQLLYLWLLEQDELMTGKKSMPGQTTIRFKWHRWVPDAFIEIVFYDSEKPWKFMIVQKQ